MKKTAYIQPQTTIVRLHTEQMLAGSPDTVSTNIEGEGISYAGDATSATSGDVKSGGHQGYSVWDDAW